MKISHIMAISKILTDLCAIRQEIGIKNNFKDIFYSVLSAKKALQEHKNVCLKIISKKRLKLTSPSIEFKNCLKQLAVPFKIYAVFESVLQRIYSIVRSNSIS